MLARTVGRRSQGTVLAVAVIMAAAMTAGGIVVMASAADPTIRGTNGPDRLIGTPRADTILGLGGRDLLKGRGGADVLKGGPAGDRLVGGKRDDRMIGAGGNDVIYARDGHRDTIDCGAGRDSAIVDRAEDGVYDCEGISMPRGKAAR
jgi:Ca2+-binding RTX toxin-like protein